MHNPTAGQGRHTREGLTAALRAAGYAPRYQSTDEDDYGRALEDPGDLVVVAGGDGTVDKVVGHMIGRTVPIAVIPLGTANNTARTMGIGGTVEEVVAAWSSARPRCCDVGLAEGPWGETHFFEAAGVGLFPEMIPVLDALKQAASFESRQAELLHDLRFLKEVLPDFPAHDWTMRLDGREVAGRYLLVEVMNVGAIGPHLSLAPAADPGDGFFDVVLVPEAERDRLRAYVARCMTHGRVEPAAAPAFTVHRARHVALCWDGAEVHLDSNIVAEQETPYDEVEQVAGPGRTTVHFRVQQGVVTFLWPA